MTGPAFDSGPDQLTARTDLPRPDDAAPAADPDAATAPLSLADLRSPAHDVQPAARGSANLLRRLLKSQPAEDLWTWALPGGTLIEGFRLIRPIGKGGFGIVYLAWDIGLERHVAIKEYMPSSMAMRVEGSTALVVRPGQDPKVFAAGLGSFVHEARLLARFDHPALVRVFRFWEANNTAYMVMPYYQGPTLTAALAMLPGRATEAQLRRWMEPLLDALAVLHREHCYHRDISPDNILLTEQGPLLLDFGAARREIGARAQGPMLSTVLKPGFAPIEQYGAKEPQGPWTDLYGLAGVVYYALEGRPPPAATARLGKDTLRPLSKGHAGRYGAGFLAAIDAALSLRPEDRPRDVVQFRAWLDQPDEGGPDGMPWAFARTARAGLEGAPDDADGLTRASALDGETEADRWQNSLWDRMRAQPQPPAKLRRRMRTLQRVGLMALLLVTVAGASVWWRARFLTEDGSASASVIRAKVEPLPARPMDGQPPRVQGPKRRASGSV